MVITNDAAIPTHLGHYSTAQASLMELYSLCLRVCACVEKVCVCLTQHYHSITGAGFCSHSLPSVVGLFMHVCVCMCVCVCVCVCMYRAICTIANTALRSPNT